ncbi:MAG: M48 family metalloprotease [Coriobacteriia bacterium]|nr:M48 family metalloprotease [Coriobacteriia bacterium]
MAQRPSPTLANAVASGVRVEHIEPLQRRVERNRWKFLGFMLAFTSVVALGLFTAAVLVTLLVVLFVYGTAWELAPALRVPLGVALAASVVIAWVWALSRLARSEVSLVERLEARMPAGGSLLPTKSMLRDMAIAAGLPKTPPLYVIDTPKVNAFVVGRSAARVRIGVTRGFVERIVVDEQRAVFANLIARVLTLDTLWATAVSALMGPIWAMRDYDLAYDPTDPLIDGRLGGKPRSATEDQRAAGFILYGLAVVLTELMAWYHRKASWAAAEKADAEGMLLLKDPRSMLRAIENVLERDNHVPTAGDAYSQIFFCWAGFGFAPEQDPEMRRVARLRETLGAAGAPYIPRPNVPGWPTAPRAPRLDLADELARERDADAL